MKADPYMMKRPKHDPDAIGKGESLKTSKWREREIVEALRAMQYWQHKIVTKRAGNDTKA